MTTPRSGDERFFTPRSTARTGGYISSGDEREEKFHNVVDPRGRMHSARSWTSDADYCTPRSTGASSGSEVPDSYYEAKQGGVPIVPMPFVASNNSYGKTAISSSSFAPDATHSAGYDSHYGSASYQPRNQTWAAKEASATAHYSSTAAVSTHNDISAVAYNTASQSSAAGSYSEDTGWAPTPAAGTNFESNESYPDATYREEDLLNVFSFARHSRTKDLEKLLNSTGIPANVRDKHGNTILIVACQNGLKRVAKLALRRGADINARNYKGNTCLHFCFAYGYGETLGQYLMSKGADSSLRNTAGLSCFQGLQAE